MNIEPCLVCNSKDFVIKARALITKEQTTSSIQTLNMDVPVKVLTGEDFHIEPFWYQVVCERCGTMSGVAPTAQGAIDEWNGDK